MRLFTDFLYLSNDTMLFHSEFELIFLVMLQNNVCLKKLKVKSSDLKIIYLNSILLVKMTFKVSKFLLKTEPLKSKLITVINLIFRSILLTFKHRLIILKRKKNLLRLILNLL